MIVAAFLIILTLLALFAGPFIRRHNVKIYIIAVLVSVLSYILKDKPIFAPFMKGFLGLAFFYIVMITGALPNRNKLRIKFMGLRREFSIIGFIVSTPHALLYIVKWIDGTRSLEWFGFIAFVLMIPLFITSFKSIRNKMSLKNWRLLQSIAYVIYVLLFIHLVLSYSEKINLILYLAMFVPYFALKGYYEINAFIQRRKKKELA